MQEGFTVLRGKSGKWYGFLVYPMGTSFKEVGAVYVFTRAARNSQGGYIHNIVYVGQTGELGTRLSSHHKKTCIERHGANRICVRVTSTLEERLKIEADLCTAYQPPCNELLR